MLFILTGFVCTATEFHVELKPPNKTVTEGTPVTLECCVSVPNVFPMWEINGTNYRVTNLPLNYEADGTNITFRATSDVILRCFFFTFSNGNFDTVHSNFAHVMTTPPPDGTGMFL